MNNGLYSAVWRIPITTAGTYVHYMLGLAERENGTKSTEDNHNARSVHAPMLLARAAARFDPKANINPQCGRRRRRHNTVPPDSEVKQCFKNRYRRTLSARTRAQRCVRVLLRRHAMCSGEGRQRWDVANRLSARFSPCRPPPLLPFSPVAAMARATKVTEVCSAFSSCLSPPPRPPVMSNRHARACSWKRPPRHTTHHDTTTVTTTDEELTRTRALPPPRIMLHYH